MENTRRVIVDITHYPHINFYKYAIKILKEKQMDIDIIIRPRGNLVSIFKKEYDNVPFTQIGKHRPSLRGKIFDLIGRDIRFLIYLRKKNFDVATGVGSISLSHATHILRKPSVIFEDDIEYKLGFDTYKYAANYIVMPRFIPLPGSNILKYNGFKELAYLHPNYFKPNKKSLEQYGVKPNEYVFVREVSKASLNYKFLDAKELQKVIEYLKDMNFKIILSLEDKTLVRSYEDECIILKEPIDDIHSLLYFASLTVSSGDTMARESCLLGTPAIYLGKRNMCVNRELINRSCMLKIDERQNLNTAIKNILENDLKKETKYTIEKAIKYEWADTTEVIVEILSAVINKDESLIKKYS